MCVSLVNVDCFQLTDTAPQCFPFCYQIIKPQTEAPSLGLTGSMTHTSNHQRRETAVQLQTLETVWQGLCGLARLSGKSILDCGFREQRHGDGSESGIGTVSCPY